MNGTCNGWKNYPTWNVNLWIDENQGSSNFKDGLVEQAVTIGDLATSLKDWIEEDNPLGDQANMFSDLLGYALQQVDWRELAESYWEEKEIEDEDIETEDEDIETCDRCGDSEKEDDTLSYRPEYGVKLCNVCFRTRELIEKGDDA